MGDRFTCPRCNTQFDPEVGHVCKGVDLRQGDYYKLPPAHRLGDAPIDEAYRQHMNDLARAIDQVFNGELRGADRPTGFVLLAFPYGDVSGRCNFISNGADRKDLVVLFKEMIARFEGQPETKGKA